MYSLKTNYWLIINQKLSICMYNCLIINKLEIEFNNYLEKEIYCCVFFPLINVELQ